MFRRLFLAALIFAALPTGAFGATQEICSGSALPGGWIKVDHYFRATQCTPSPFTYNVSLLESFFDKPAKAIITACWNSPTPTGWVTTDKLTSATRCPEPLVTYNNKKIYKVATTDTQLTVCHDSPRPTGWIQTDDSSSATVCPAPPTTYNRWLIKRYDNKPVGATLDVCSDAVTPGGWTVTATFWRATQCHHTGGNMKTIRRIS